jgi:protein TonB
MKILFALLLTSCSNLLFAQDTISIVNPSTGKIEKSIYVDQLPKATYDVNEYITGRIRYPKSKLKGKLEISFMVNADGSISNVKLVKGLQPDVDAEVLKIARTMPGWQPAKYRGKAVPSAYTLPISF